MLSRIRMVPASFPELPETEEISEKATNFTCTTNEGPTITFSIPHPR